MHFLMWNSHLNPWGNFVGCIALKNQCFENPHNAWSFCKMTSNNNSEFHSYHPTGNGKLKAGKWEMISWEWNNESWWMEYCNMRNGILKAGVWKVVTGCMPKTALFHQYSTPCGTRRLADKWITETWGLRDDKWNVDSWKVKAGVMKMVNWEMESWKLK